MSFFSGFECDECGITLRMVGMTAWEIDSITHLRSRARKKGWSVGKEKLLCDVCRKQKKTDRSPANQSQK